MPPESQRSVTMPAASHHSAVMPPVGQRSVQMSLVSQNVLDGPPPSQRNIQMPPVSQSALKAPPISQRAISDHAETLDVIKEEQGSHSSSININDVTTTAEVVTKCEDCLCKEPPPVKELSDVIKKDDVEIMLQERDVQLRKQFEDDLELQINFLKERFDFILQNEQVRTSAMLREAHRERQEKISALQSQLECKNMAALMYVMCAERRRGKLEKLRVIEEYTGYIRGLQEILTDGQNLILNLSRGYKTAARVDHEWREKMKKIIKEFQAYIMNFNGGTPEASQYLFDIPQLLKTKAAVQDDPKEDPCEEEEEEQAEIGETVKEEVPWWEQIEGDCRPFIMFGDMGEFTPPQRRATLKTVKAAQTAPKKWKKYVFNEMYLRADCSNLDLIKDEQEKRFPLSTTWECHAVQTGTLNREESSLRSKYDLSSHRYTSIDARGNMGSILKIITASSPQEPVTKANLLGARDSMEITSTTKLKEKHSSRRSSQATEKIDITHSRYGSIDLDAPLVESKPEDESVPLPEDSKESKGEEAADEESSQSMLGSIHNDSLQVMTTHKPEKDHKINYEKVCPMEKCKRMQMDSFIRSLPPYMRASPYLHFEQTFDAYETCSPEQLEMLKARIEAKKKKKHKVAEPIENILEEWAPEVEGVAVQTSEGQLFLPPCTCELPKVSSASLESGGRVFRIQDLLPLKKALDEIQEKCFFDDEVDFDRFEVVGQDSDLEIPATQEDFKKKRLTEIYRILKKHPSLCDLFQANTT